MAAPGRPIGRRTNLPHAFPFELVDRSAEGSVVIRVSAGQSASRGRTLPAALAVEMLAQAAIVELGSAPRGESPAPAQEGPKLLVGIEDARFEQPLRPGTTLRAEVEMLGAFGRVMKVGGLLRDEAGEPVARARLLLADGG